MTPMNTAELETLIRERIEDTTPRVTFGDGSAFVAYAQRPGQRQQPIRKGAPTSQRARRFWLEWLPEGASRLGTGSLTWSAEGAEHVVLLAVCVEYTAPQTLDATRLHAAIDDFHLLRDRLDALRGPSSAMMLVEAQDVRDLGTAEDQNSRIYALTYRVRYFGTVAIGA